MRSLVGKAEVREERWQTLVLSLYSNRDHFRIIFVEIRLVETPFFSVFLVEHTVVISCVCEIFGEGWCASRGGRWARARHVDCTTGRLSVVGT